MRRQGYSFKTAVICIFQGLIVLFAPAQPPGGIFYHLTSKNGLSSNRANGVIQDREGYYWIATQDGLNRFDGSSCKVFRSNKNDSTSLSHNNCTYLLEDDNGDIWVATPRGVNRFIKKAGRFKRYYLSHPAMLSDQVNAVKGMVKDEVGNIWIVSAGLWQYNIYTQKWTRYLHDPDNPNSIPAGFNNWLQYDKREKGLWMSNNGFVFFEIATGKFYHPLNNIQHHSLFKFNVAGDAFVLDSAGAIWFYKYPGGQLCCYSVKEKVMKIYPEINHSGGIYSASVDAGNRIWFNHWSKRTEIYDPVIQKKDTGFLAHFHQQSPLTEIATQLFIDKTGNYWISSAKGVSIYNPHAQGIKYYWLDDKRKREMGLENSITCIAEQKDNIVWVGTAAALFRYDLSQKKLRSIEHLPLNSTYIRCLYLQNDSILWIGGWRELLVFNLVSEKVLKKISLNANPQFITADEQENIWVGAWSDGLFKFSASGRLIDHLVQRTGSPVSILYDGLNCFAESYAAPGIWIGYNFEYGFFRLNYRDHAIENFKIKFGRPSAFISNTVNAIAEDKLENLWLGTSGGGLFYFDRNKNSFVSYTRSDGLKGDYINKILLDAHSNIWVTTSNGLSVIDGKTKSIINSEIDLAFDNNDYVSNGVLLKNKKLLFFSGLKIVEIDPVAFLQPSFPSRVILSSFKIFEKETPLIVNKQGRQEIRLSYNQNFFSFDYSLLKPNPETATQYAYQLREFDNDWNFVRERRNAYYTNVPPGNYKFLVRATDESGNWNYVSEPVFITISPQFWKTWWFYLLIGVLTAATIVYVLKSRVKQFRKRQKEQLRLVVATQEQEKKSISAELHDDLGVRLSALKYFVTALKDHLKPGSPLAEETYIKTLNVIDESVEDIRYLLVYLSPKTLNEYGYLIAVEDLVNKLRKLHVIDIDLKQNGIEQRMPAEMEAGLYRITQELINNTLKHALATSIHLSIECVNGNVKVQYADNGKGFDPALHGEGYGMQNIHTRVALLNGKIEWDTSKGKSTRVIITIPYHT